MSFLQIKIGIFFKLNSTPKKTFLIIVLNIWMKYENII
jgi:hypothetical protein